MKNVIWLFLFVLPVTLFVSPASAQSPPPDSTWKYAGNPYFSAGGTTSTSLAFNAIGELFVAYTDNANGHKVSVRKLTGTGWVLVGQSGFSAGLANWLSIAVSPAGEPWVAYLDSTHNKKCSVMKFNGTNWVNVGAPGFTLEIAYWISLVFSPAGEAYVSYTGGCPYNNPALMKFDGTGWVVVGNAGFSAGMGYYADLAFNSSGEPCLVFQDWANGHKATVRKYDGSGWVTIGQAGFTPSVVYDTRLAFSPSGEPWVAYVDSTCGYKLTVMKFNGAAWVNVGTPGFTYGDSGDMSLTISPAGKAYVAYMEPNNSMKASVMRFDGTAWVQVGAHGFTPGVAFCLSLAVSPSGSPYVAFADEGSDHSFKTSVMKYDSGCAAQVAGPVTGLTQVCRGVSGVYAIEALPGAISYMWSVPPGCAIASGNGTKSVTVNFGPNAASGQISVTVTGNCYSTSSHLHVNVGTSTSPSIAGSNSLCVNSGYYCYSAETGMNSYQWTVSPGGTVLFGQGTDSIQVMWNQAGIQTVSVMYINGNGCTSMPVSYPVMVNPLPAATATISGTPEVCAGTGGAGSPLTWYTVAPVAHATTYVWQLPAGATIETGDGTNSIGVSFDGNAISGNIIVYGNNLCGNGPTSPDFPVTVNPVPATPVIVKSGDSLYSSAPIGNQWYCNGLLLPGDTNRVIFASASLPGLYCTRVTLRGCVSDTSNEILFGTVGIKEKRNPGITLVPNPAQSTVKIITGEFPGSDRSVEILDVTGRRVFISEMPGRQLSVDVTSFPPGYYFVKVLNRPGTEVRPLIIR